jgi:predicted dehydrogenase
MDEIEAVNIAAYNQRTALLRWTPHVKHVLVGKPMAATPDDAAAMTKAAHETGKILMIAPSAPHPHAGARDRRFKNRETPIT